MSMFTKNDQGTDQSRPAHEPQQAAPAASSVPGTHQVVSVISPGLTVTGNLESEGAIQVDGTIEGDVRGNSVVVGEGATIKGAVYGDTVKVAGKIEGKIEAQSVSVTRSGHMKGDIIHERLEIEGGAHVDGHCQPTFKKDAGKVTQLKPAAETNKASDSSKTANADS